MHNSVFATIALVLLLPLRLATANQSSDKGKPHVIIGNYDIQVSRIFIKSSGFCGNVEDNAQLFVDLTITYELHEGDRQLVNISDAQLTDEKGRKISGQSDKGDMKPWRGLLGGTGTCYTNITLDFTTTGKWHGSIKSLKGNLVLLDDAISEGGKLIKIPFEFLNIPVDQEE